MTFLFVLARLLLYAAIAAATSNWDGIARFVVFIVCLVAAARLVRAGLRGLIDRTNTNYWAAVGEGLCRHCGYDKRVDPAGRCPECGLE